MQLQKSLKQYQKIPKFVVLQHVDGGAAEVKVSRSGKRIIVGTAFRLEFLVGWYHDAATRFSTCLSIQLMSKFTEPAIAANINFTNKSKL